MAENHVGPDGAGWRYVCPRCNLEIFSLDLHRIRTLARRHEGRCPE